MHTSTVVYQLCTTFTVSALLTVSAAPSQVVSNLTDSGIACLSAEHCEPEQGVSDADGFVGIAEAADAAAFIVEHPHLAALVSDAVRRLEAIFTTGSRVVVRLVPAWPSEGTPAQIEVAVQTTLDLERATELLNRFDEEWWLDSMKPANGLLTVNLELR